MGGKPVRIADLADINVALAVHGEAVRREEAAGLQPRPVLAAEAGDYAALLVDDGEPRAEVGVAAVDRHARTQLTDDEVGIVPAARAAVERTGPVHVVPLQLVPAVAVEYLHAVVLAVGDVDPAVVVGGDVVGDVELAGIGAGGAPAHQVFAVGRVLVDAGIAVAVGNVDLALGRKCRVGTAVERLTAQERRRLVGHADGHQHLAVAGDLADGVVAVVGTVKDVV